MKVIKPILLFTAAILITILFAFKSNVIKKNNTDELKCEYAILYLNYGYQVIDCDMKIQYSDGNIEDLMKIKKITNNDLMRTGTKITIETFDYLNQQGYEFKSSSLSIGEQGKINKEFFFLRKVSQ